MRTLDIIILNKMLKNLAAVGFLIAGANADIIDFVNGNRVCFTNKGTDDLEMRLYDWQTWEYSAYTKFISRGENLCHDIATAFSKEEVSENDEIEPMIKAFVAKSIIDVDTHIYYQADPPLTVQYICSGDVNFYQCKHDKSHYADQLEFFGLL